MAEQLLYSSRKLHVLVLIVLLFRVLIRYLAAIIIPSNESVHIAADTG